jgi:endonuclease/exonuclease/phosphatase family metal-dependent hydrolase
VTESHLIGSQVVDQVAGYTWHGVNRAVPLGARRGRDGVGFLIRDRLAACTEFLATCSTPRMAWIRVRQAAHHARDIYICAFYSPLSREAADAEEAYESLTAAARRFGERGDVVIAGDMNAHTGLLLGPGGDASRPPNANGDKLIAMCRTLGLTAANVQLGAVGQMTRKPSPAAREEDGTLIDYVLTSSRLTGAVLSCDASWMDANSDHCPVRVVLDTPVERDPSRRAPHTFKRWAFKNTRALFDWSHYAAASRVPLRALAAACRAQAATAPADPAARVQTAWRAISDEVMSLMHTHVGQTVATKGGKWWWSKALSALAFAKRVARRAWHRRKSEAARESYLNTRRAYNAAVRKAKDARETEELCGAETAHRTFELQKLFWHVIRKRQGNTPTLPQALEGKDGARVSDSAERLRAIHDYYVELSAPASKDDASFDPAFLRRMEALVAAVEAGTVPDASDVEAATPVPVPVSAGPIDTAPSRREVCDAIDRLKCWKAGGVDQWVPECIVKADRGAITEALTALFAVIWEARTVPDEWRRGAVVLIAKRDADTEPHKIGSYRPITLLCVASKVLEHVINTRLHAWAEANGILDDSQGGFRHNRGGGDLVFVLSEMLQRRRERAGHPTQPVAQATYLAFIDVKKAYDSVDHTMLFAKLWAKGVRGTTWALLRSWYKGSRSHVRVEGDQTEDFDVLQGVKQGGVLSPMLYALFLDDLLRELRASGHGAWEDGVNLGTLAYADDLSMCADNRRELNAMLQIAERYAVKMRFRFKPSKSEIMVVVPTAACVRPATPDGKTHARLTPRAAAAERPDPTPGARPPTWLARGHAPDTRQA